ncbi:MAG: radical SAM protein [Parcubacteria group bacterium]|nr:radical SAM protein [Parcubacteria group bacterium]
MMKTYKIYTLGCKVNQYDSGKLSAQLQAAGLVMAGKQADLAIINSCAVTKTAMIKSGRMIRSAKKENPGAKIALIGCWVRASETKLAGVDFVIGGKEIIKQINRIMNYESGIRNKIQNPNNKNNKIIINSDKSRYFIKIQDGCEQFCSYCIIPYARGGLKSRGEAEVIGEVEQAVKAGYGEIVLSGIHLGLYGKESQLLYSVIPASEPPRKMRGGLRITRPYRTGTFGREPAMTNYYNGARDENLASLLKKLVKLKNLGRIRLSSIEITEVSDELIELIKNSGKICRQLHLPLQSGSDKILKLMNRPYDMNYFKNKIKQIRRVLPDMAITTDVIVGFPGESEKDFRATEKFIRQIKFSRLHVFPFSAQEKTSAAKMSGQVKEKIKKRRADLLRKLNLKLMADYKNKFKGRDLKIAVEQIKQNKVMGKTEYYFDVSADKKSLKNKNIRVGQIIKIKI